MAANPVSTSVTVPFLDLAPSHAEIKERVVADIADVIDSSAFINGPAVAAFEEEFASFVGTRHCVGAASGLDALRLGLIAAGIGSGDEVIVPANTFIATFEAVSQVGATPIPVDATEDDYNLDVRAAVAAVGERTRCLLPVHLYGQVADMRAIGQLAMERALVVVEDACQAHGAIRDGVVAGTAGTAAAFSFYPGKNLGAFGDAGALVTSDAEIAAVARALREHGQRAKYRHEHIGFTSRLDTIQAVALRHKLPLLRQWTRERQHIAAFYSESLAAVGDLRLPPVAPDSEPVYHLYVVRTADPDGLAAFLGERGIGTGRHYPEPPHLSAAYASLGYGRGAFPVTEALARESLSLPIFPGMADEQQALVVAAIAAYFERG